MASCLESCRCRFLIPALLHMSQKYLDAPLIRKHSSETRGSCISSSIASGDRGTFLGSPFFVIGNCAILFSKLMFSHVKEAISPIRMAVSMAKRKACITRFSTVSSDSEYFTAFFSISISLSEILLSRGGFIFGFLMSVTGFFSVQCHSLIATVKIADISNSSLRTVTPCTCFMRSSRYAAKSDSLGSMMSAIGCCNNLEKKDSSHFVILFVGVTSSLYLMIYSLNGRFTLPSASAMMSNSVLAAQSCASLLVGKTAVLLMPLRRTNARHLSLYLLIDAMMYKKCVMCTKNLANYGISCPLCNVPKNAHPVEFEKNALLWRNLSLQ